ncbi:MAG: DEAD/DEAH box helicase, partial [Candidatus Xenobia bacterium]
MQEGGYAVLAPQDLGRAPRSSVRILHGLWHEDERTAGLCIWGEVQGEGAVPRPRERGRAATRGVVVELHPFSIPVDGIRESLAALIGLSDLPAMAAADVPIYLPAAGGRPVPRSTPGWQPVRFRVPSCRLTPQDALLLLAAVVSPQQPAVCAGPDLALWIAASRWMLNRLLYHGSVTIEGGLVDLDDPQVDSVVPLPGRTLLEYYLQSSLDPIMKLRQGNRWVAPRQWPPAARTWGEKQLEMLGQETPTAAVAAVCAFPLVTGVPSTDWRLCIRLEAPDEAEATDKNWGLRFMQQSISDPSLVVHPEIDGNLDALQVDLARAAHIWGRLRPERNPGHPLYCELSVSEVCEFLQMVAGQMQEGGFVVQVPNWMERPRTSVRLRLRVSEKDFAARGPGVLGLESLVDYQWEVALGGTRMSVVEFQQLVAMKLPVVRVRGQWMMLDKDGIDGALKMVRGTGPSRGLKLKDAFQIAAGGEDYLPEVELMLEGRLSALQSGDSLVELTQPAGFQGELRPYQTRGFSWLVFLRDRGLGACLADDMGLGKTIQLIALLLDGYDREKPTVEPTLIVCPTSVVGNWKRELERFAPQLKVMVHHGGDRLSHDAFREQAAAHHVIVTTYPLVVRDNLEMGGVLWDGIVLDEAQYIKNAGTMQARAIRVLRSAYRVALTGTPVENRLSDLWSIMEFL